MLHFDIVSSNSRQHIKRKTQFFETEILRWKATLTCNRKMGLLSNKVVMEKEFLKEGSRRRRHRKKQMTFYYVVIVKSIYSNPIILFYTSSSLTFLERNVTHRCSFCGTWLPLFNVSYLLEWNISRNFAKSKRWFCEKYFAKNGYEKLQKCTRPILTHFGSNSKLCPKYVYFRRF